MGRDVVRSVRVCRHVRLDLHIGVQVRVEGVASRSIDASLRSEVELLGTADAPDSIKIGSSPTADSVVGSVSDIGPCCQDLGEVTRSSDPARVAKEEAQSVVVRMSAVLEVGVEDKS